MMVRSLIHFQHKELPQIGDSSLIALPETRISYCCWYGHYQINECSTVGVYVRVVFRVNRAWLAAISRADLTEEKL